MKVAQAQEIPTQLGQAYGGGYFGGYYSLNADGVATHALIVAPVSARSVQPIIVSGAPASNSTSNYDGVFNTNAMIAAGAADQITVLAILVVVLLIGIYHHGMNGTLV
jgi:hypothetical protein